ncbi:hypothetical protein WJS89_09575 [Sphingomicrobium sp. XHP0235]|uniref:hypothetical protein n=1 Tax=Sphingomicrobium aquimarinum TaxID=3133971 RepID=UPI0031FEC4C6
MRDGGQSQNFCGDVLAAMAQEILLVGPAGKIRYANRAAIETFGLDVDEHGALDDILKPPDGLWQGRMRNAAQSSTLVPMNLTSRGGQYAGMEMKFRARGLRSSDDGTTLLMLIADRERDAGFTQLRKLVRDLNAELAQRKTLQGKLEDALESEQPPQRTHSSREEQSRLAQLARPPASPVGQGRGNDRGARDARRPDPRHSRSA